MDSIQPSDVNLIIMACEAGMGSSLMVVNSIKKKLKKSGVTGVKLVHKPARSVPESAKLIIVHEGLANVVRRKAPEAVIVTFKHFLNDPALDALVKSFAEGSPIKNTVS